MSSGIPEQRLAFLLKRAQHSFRMRVDDALRPLRLTAPQFAVLAAVGSDDGISNAELSRLAFVTPPTMHGILANLERDGLLARSPHPQNGRVLRIALTKRGRETFAQAREHVQKIENLLSDAIGPGEEKQFAEMLSRCADQLASE